SDPAETFRLDIETVGMAVVGKRPDVSVTILEEMIYPAALRGNVTVSGQAVGCESITVEPAQSIPSAEPHEPAPVLKDVGDGVLRKSVLRSIVHEIGIRLRLEGKNNRKDE